MQCDWPSAAVNGVGNSMVLRALIWDRRVMNIQVCEPSLVTNIDLPAMVATGCSYDSGHLHLCDKRVAYQLCALLFAALLCACAGFGSMGAGLESSAAVQKLLTRLKQQYDANEKSGQQQLEGSTEEETAELKQLLAPLNMGRYLKQLVDEKATVEWLSSLEGEDLAAAKAVLGFPMRDMMDIKNAAKTAIEAQTAAGNDAADEEVVEEEVVDGPLNTGRL